MGKNIFISHSSKEADIAAKLCDVLEKDGNHCFIAPRDIRSGYVYAEEIANGIDRSHVILLILSEAANRSPHVLREIERAVTKSIPIIVYKVEEVELSKSMEYFLMTHQWMEAKTSSYADVVKGIHELDFLPSSEMVVNSGAGIEKDGDKGVKPFGMLVAALAIVAMVVVGVVAISINSNVANDSALSAENNQVIPDDIKLGDTIVMGTYNGEEIYWRVLKISEDGKEAVLVTRDVITVKAYDAADSGCYNHDGTVNYSFEEEKLETDIELQAYVRGNSSWENSNIRTWLNSAAENVEYEGQAPTSKAMADGVNGYNNEKGFLNSFTAEELALIKTTEVVTKGNALSDQDTVVTRDKIYLLSLEELEWFKEADVSLVAPPTEGAIANDKSSWYQDYCVDYGVENTMWWLREPVEGKSSMCYLVGNGYSEENIYQWEVGVESFGIRPAMTVEINSESANE